MQAIVCVSKNWGIGRDGRLLFHLSADLKRFHALTAGKTVIYGYNTLLTFPGEKPLPERRNILLSRRDISVPGATVAHSIEEAVALAGDDAIVIGGASVYVALLDRCDRVFVTAVDAEREADSYFPDLDHNPAWRRAGESEWFEEKGLRFRYIDYERVERN